MPETNVAVIGAGPYGLACTAHLRAAGLETRLIGPRMTFWAQNMPHGMFLRSPWLASSISDPSGSLTLDAYQSDTGEALSRPVPLADFLRYADWFGAHVAPDVDERRVVRLERLSGGYRLTLDDGETELARRVVVATGLESFERIPAQLQGLPADRALHSCRLNDLSGFAGMSVAVVGAGQSAVESAALLAEAGAHVELIARTSAIRWLKSSSVLHSSPGPLLRLLYHPTDVGPPGLNQINAHPRVFRLFPLRLQERMAYRSIRPAASTWLRDRVTDVTISCGRTIASASPDGDGLSLRLDDGSARSVERLVMATGFQVDLTRHPLMSPELRAALELDHGSPHLRRGLESSLPGLHFVGAAAARSFGPLMRFVSGTTYAAPALAAELAKGARSAAPVVRPQLAAARASGEGS